MAFLTLNTVSWCLSSLITRPFPKGSSFLHMPLSLNPIILLAQTRSTCRSYLIQFLLLALWHWANFIADQDFTFDICYHKMMAFLLSRVVWEWRGMKTNKVLLDHSNHWFNFYYYYQWKNVSFLSTLMFIVIIGIYRNSSFLTFSLKYNLNFILCFHSWSL